MREHESFRRPLHLRPRSSGVAHVASPRSIAPEQLANEATQTNAAATLSERLQIPRPGSATSALRARRPVVTSGETTALRPTTLLSKPPMRPHSAAQGARGIVSNHRMELLQKQPSSTGDNQTGDDRVRHGLQHQASTVQVLAPQLQRAKDNAEKDDHVQPAISAPVSVDDMHPKRPLKRPFSAAPTLSKATKMVRTPESAAKIFQSTLESLLPAPTSNQHGGIDASSAGPRMTRPSSAAPTLRGATPCSNALESTSLDKDILLSTEQRNEVGDIPRMRTPSIQSSSDGASIMTSFHADTFVYAVPRHCLQHGCQYNPYDIVTVSHEALFGTKVSARAEHRPRYDFYTVSSAGMTFHCMHDNFEPTFLTSLEWERQRVNFYRICKLPTFRMFRYRKIFLGWKKWIRSMKVEFARTTMQTSLYFTQPFLSQGMIAIRSELVTLDDVNLMCDLDGETLHLSQFSVKSRNHVQSQGMEILRISGRIQQILLQVCQECLNSTENPSGGFPGHEFALSTRKSSNFHIFETFVERERALATANHRLVQHHHFQNVGPMHTSKVSLSTAAQLRTTHRKYMERVIRSQQQQPQDALDEIRWTLASIQRRQCLSLTKFVSLVDFMVLDALHSILVRSIQLLRDSLSVGANAASISKLIDRRDYVFAFHKTVNNAVLDSTSHTGQASFSLFRSNALTLNKQQMKRFLRTVWEAKLPVILRVPPPGSHEDIPVGADSEQLKSSATVWLESRLDLLFSHALRTHSGESADLFSFDDAMGVVEQTMAEAFVLPEFEASKCSIFSCGSEDNLMVGEPENVASIIRQLQNFECLKSVPLLHMTMILQVDQRSNHCEIIFKPSLDQISNLMQEVLTSFIEVMIGIPSVIMHQEVRAVLEFAEDFQASHLPHDVGGEANRTRRSLSDDGNEEEARWNKSNYDRLFTRIGNDRLCLLLRMSIDELLNSAIVGAAALARLYDPALVTYTKNENIDFETYRIRFRNGEYSIRDMEGDVRGFNSVIEDLNRLTVSQSVEFLQFSVNQLKEALLPSPTRCARQLHELFPTLALEKCEAFLGFIRAACKKIEKPVVIDDLEAFARYLLHLRDVQDEVQEKESDLTFIQDLFAMLKRLDIEVPTEIGDVLDLCEPEFEALKSQINEAMAKKDADIVERSPLLAERISKLNTGIEDIKTYSSDQAINSAHNVSSAARSLANELEKQSENLVQQSTQLVWIQRVFAEFAQASRPQLEEFSDLQVVSSELKMKNELWEAVNNVEEYLDTKKDETLRDIDLDEVRKILANVDNVIGRVHKNALQIAAIKRLENSKSVLEGLSPVIRDLRNEHLEDRHWTKLEYKMNCSFVRIISPVDKKTDAGQENATDHSEAINEARFLDLPLRHLLEIEAVNHAVLIHQVSEEASAEAAIKKSFQSVSQTWETRDIPSSPKKDRDGRDAIYLGECTEILTLLEESEVLLRVMESSSYARVIQTKLTKLLHDLSLTKEAMELLVLCQQKRENLQRLVSVDFVRSFPDQNKKLQLQDAKWKSIMEGVSKRPLCLPFGINTENRQLLKAVLEGFEVASQCVEQHLEMKRESFPGFFKLSNTELAVLLSKLRDVNNVQRFLYQCFDNVGRVNFGTREASQDILSLTSRTFPHAETIRMGRNLKARGPPEQWLLGIEKRLTDVLRKSTKDGVFLLSQNSGTGSVDSSALQALPLQCILLADRILRAELIDTLLPDGGATQNSIALQSNLYGKLSHHHATIMGRMFGLNPRDGLVVSSLSPRDIVLLSSLRLHEIEFRDAAGEHLIAVTTSPSVNGNKTTGPGVHWQFQIKHRFDDSTTVGYDCHVEIGGTRVPYGFNYVNVNPELVFTPRSMRFIFSIFAATRLGQTVLLTGQHSSGKQSLALQTSLMFGRRFFGFIASNASGTHSFCSVAHCLKLMRGSLLAGGVLCIGFRIHEDVINIFRVLGSTVARIQNSVLCKLPISGLQNNPITWIAGTSLLFTCDLTSTSSHQRSSTLHRFDAATTSFSRISVLVEHDMSVVLEALIYSKQLEAPNRTAKKLVLLWSHLCSLDGWKNERPDDEFNRSMFTLQTAKYIITKVAEDAWKNTEPFEREKLQSLLICESVLSLCSPLFLVGAECGATARSRVVASLDEIFEYTNHQSEWYTRQWKRWKTSNSEEETKKFEEMIAEAALELHYLPRPQLVLKSLELAAGFATSVGVIVVGPSGVGKSTTYNVLSQALDNWKNTLVAQSYTQDLQQMQPQTSSMHTSFNSAVEPITVPTDRKAAESPTGPFVKICVMLPMSLTLSQIFGSTGSNAKGQVKSLLGSLIRDAQESYALGTDHEIQFTMKTTSSSPGLGSLLSMQRLTWIVFDGGSICGGAWLDVLLSTLSRKYVFGLMDACANLNRELVRFADDEFMTIPPNLRFVFDTWNLENASPAVLQHCAVVAFSPDDCMDFEKEDDMPIHFACIQRFLELQRDAATFGLDGVMFPPSLMKLSTLVYDIITTRLLETDILGKISVVIEDYGVSVHISLIRRVEYMLAILQALLSTVAASCAAATGSTPVSTQAIPEEDVRHRVEMAMVYALLWGFSCCCARGAEDTRSRALQLLISGIVKSHFECISHTWEDCGREVNLFELLLDINGLRFVSLESGDINVLREKMWRYSLASSGSGVHMHQQDSQFHSLFIPTQSSLTVHAAMKEAARSARGVLLVGSDTSRKTTLLQNYLKQLEVVRVVTTSNYASIPLPVATTTDEKTDGRTRRRRGVARIEAPPIPHTENAYASLDRIRLHHVTLVRRLAKRFRNVNKAAATAAALAGQRYGSSKGGVSTGSPNPNGEKLNKAAKKPAQWALRPHLEATKSDMVGKFDLGDFIPFYFAMNQHDRGIDELAKCLERMLQRERSGIYEPPPGKTAVLLIDDLHLPVVAHDEEHPSCHEYLRSAYEYSTVFSTKVDDQGAAAITIENLMMVASVSSRAIPCRTSAHAQSPPISTRRLSMEKVCKQFIPVYAPPCSLLELHTIFNSLILAHWERKSSSPSEKISAVVRQTLPIIIAATTVLWERLRRRQNPMPTSPVLMTVIPTLCLHDLRRVYEGICAVEPSFILDMETMVRLWANEAMKSFGAVSLPEWKSVLKTEIFRTRILLDGFDNRQYSSGTDSPIAGISTLSVQSTGPKASTTIGSTTVSSQDGEATRLTNLNTRASPVWLLSFFSSDLLDATEKKGGDMRISNQQRQVYERKRLNTIPVWAFVPSSLYYQTNNGVSPGDARAPLQRRDSIRFIRRKTLENVNEGTTTAVSPTFASSSKAASLGQIRWMYAELPLSEDIEVAVDDVAIQMTQSFFSSIRVFGAISPYSIAAKPVTDLVLQTLVGQIPRGAPTVTPLLARNIATLERVFTPFGSRNVLIGLPGSGREFLIRYSCAIRQTSQPQSIWTMEGVADEAVMVRKWKHIVFQLFQRVGVDYEAITLVVKRLHLWPQHLVGQLLALITSGEIPGAFSLEEQIKLATHVRDERLLELEQRYNAHVSRIRREVEFEKDQEMLAGSDDRVMGKTSKTSTVSYYQDLERKYQHILLIRLTQVQLRHQQELDDFLRKCEVENETVAATIMSLMRPLGMTSGKWQQIVHRMRKCLRIVILVDDDEYPAIATHIPRLLRICGVASLSPLDNSSLQTLLYGTFQSELHTTFRRDFTCLAEISDGVRNSVEERAQLSTFIDRVEHDLSKIVAMAADMHACARAIAREENRKVSTEYAFLLARFFTRLLRTFYQNGQEERRKAAWFTYVYSSMEQALWKLQDRDSELRSQLDSCDQQIEVSQELLSEQKEDCDRIRDMMKRYQESAEDQVQVTNEMEQRAQAELHVPMACLEEANAALLLIDKRHIIEIKSFNSPPLLVHLVLDSICVMFQLEPTWENARKILSDANVVHTLLTFNKDNISDEIIAKVEGSYISDPRFLREEVEKQSVAASMMVVWVRAMYQYATARRQVLPTLQKLEQAQTRLRMLMQEYQVSKQRVIDADEALAKTKETLEKAKELRRQTVDEMESRKTRLDGGRVVLECLVEDKCEADYRSQQLEKEATLGLTWWNALLTAGTLTYSHMFDGPDRLRLFEKWSEVYRCNLIEQAGENMSKDDTEIIYLPGISISAKDRPPLATPSDAPASGKMCGLNSSREPMMLFRQRGQHWMFASACGYLFSERNLQDAFLLTQTASANFPVVLITSYTPEMEDLLVRCARHIWRWTHFFMVSATDADLHSTITTAVKEGQQLLILDVDLLDIEYKLGKLWTLFHWDCAVDVPTSETGETKEYLVLGDEGDTQTEGGDRTNTSIPVHPDFRVVLCTYRHVSSFGDSLLTRVPVISAYQHASEIENVVLDRIWYPGLFEGGQYGFGLKQSVRDYDRLRRQQEEAETNLTKLIQGAAVRGQFQRDESDLIRAACSKTKNIRQSLELKEKEIEGRINAVEAHKSLARVGASIYNGINLARLNASEPHWNTLALHVFLPIFLSALRRPSSSSLSVPLPMSLARMESSDARGQSSRRLSDRSLLGQQQGSMKSQTLGSPRSNGFSTTGEIFRTMFHQLMPLVRDNSEWYKFLLHMLWFLERQNDEGELTRHPPALEAGVKYLNEASVPRVRRLLVMTKLSRWTNRAQCRDYENLPLEFQNPEQLAAFVVNGHMVAESSAMDEATEMEMLNFSNVFTASRCRAERVKTTMAMYPKLVGLLCDSTLQLYGVQVRFTVEGCQDQFLAASRLSLSSMKTSVRDFASEQIDETIDLTQRKVTSLWMKTIEDFPVTVCFVVRTEYEFGSYELLRRVFFSTLPPDINRIEVLKAAVARSFRSSDDLYEVFFLPNQRLQSSDTRGDIRSALSMMGENALMVRDVSTFLGLERSKRDSYLNDVPLAVINLHNVGDTLQLMTYWEDLYHIINSSPDRTTSMELRRFEKGVSSVTMPSQTGLGSSSADGAIALGVSTRGNAARRFSTQNLKHRRSDAASLAEGSTSTSFATVVQDCSSIPHHLRAAMVTFASESNELGSNRTPSFKECIQEALVRVAHHPCGDTFRQLLGSSTDQNTKGSPNEAVDSASSSVLVQVWPYITMLIIHHAMLMFRWQLMLRQYTTPSSANTSFGRYSHDVLITGLDQLLQIFLQMRCPNKSMQSTQVQSDLFHMRIRQQVFVTNYIRQTKTQHERTMIRSLSRECLGLIMDSSRTHTEASSSHPSLLGLSTHQGISSSRSVRSHRILQVANSSASLTTSSIPAAPPSHGFVRMRSARRGSLDTGMLSVFKGLNIPFEQLDTSCLDIDTWIEAVWTYAENVDSSVEGLVRDMFGLLTSIDPDLSPHPDSILETPWIELFGWIKHPVRYGSVISQILLDEALQCLELIHERSIPPPLELTCDREERETDQRDREESPCDKNERDDEIISDGELIQKLGDTDGNKESTTTTSTRNTDPSCTIESITPGSSHLPDRRLQSPVSTTQASFSTYLLSYHVFETCATNYNVHIHALRTFLRGTIDGLRGWKERSNRDHQELTLGDVANDKICQDVLAILCDQVPMPLLTQLDASPTYLLASTTVSLDALLSHYWYAYRNLQDQQHWIRNHIGSTTKLPRFDWWLPNVPARLSIAHVLALAQRQYQANQTNEGPEPDVELEYSLVQDQTLRSVSSNQDKEDKRTAVDDVYPDDTIAVFSGVELRLAVWDLERGYLKSLDRTTPRVPQRVKIVCHLVKRVPLERAGSFTSPTAQTSDHGRSTRSCPLVLGETIAYEFELPIGPACGPFVAPYFTLVRP